ncbi:MAG TPA: hypothetical protein DIS88_09930 [Prevotella sp.]|jgi:hypothetical protein|nr:hypothetical protein [Prevotella sp.]
MAKNSKPQTANPLAGMGLDEIVRSMTTETPSYQGEDAAGAAKTEDAAQKEEKAAPKRRRGSIKTLEENISKYKGLNEQGFAIWLPKEVKKKLEVIRLNAERTIPLRALASAIIMTYIQENEEKFNQL